MGDPISKLPMDTSQNSEDEHLVLQSLGPPQNNGQQSIASEQVHNTEAARIQQNGYKYAGSMSGEIKTMGIVAVLFAIFSSDFFRKAIARVLPSVADSWYYMLAIRTVLFVALYFLLTNLSVIRR